MLTVPTLMERIVALVNLDMKGTIPIALTLTNVVLANQPVIMTICVSIPTDPISVSMQQNAQVVHTETPVTNVKL
jgi:hypothetical protein